MTKKTKLSIIVISRNDEEMIGDCLESAKWADEIILVDSGSTDKTISIAEKYGCKIISPVSDKKDFSKWRNEGLKAAKSEWVFYLDTDERITPELAREILSVISRHAELVSASPSSQEFVSNKIPKQVRDDISAYFLPRQNYYLDKAVHYGGSWPDYVKRFFRQDKLQKWVGDLHEEPVFEGDFGYLKNPLLHYTHRDLSSMLNKTIEWSKIEAKLLYEAKHPAVTWWRILRIMLTEFWLRGVKLQGWRDGTVGWIEIIFQMFSRFVTYARLWELQQQQVPI